MRRKQVCSDLIQETVLVGSQADSGVICFCGENVTWPRSESAVPFFFFFPSHVIVLTWCFASFHQPINRFRSEETVRCEKEPKRLNNAMVQFFFFFFPVQIKWSELQVWNSAMISYTNTHCKHLEAYLFIFLIVLGSASLGQCQLKCSNLGGLRIVQRINRLISSSGSIGDKGISKSLQDGF